MQAPRGFADAIALHGVATHLLDLLHKKEIEGGATEEQTQLQVPCGSITDETVVAARRIVGADDAIDTRRGSKRPAESPA